MIISINTVQIIIIIIIIFFPDAFIQSKLD